MVLPDVSSPEVTEDVRNPGEAREHSCGFPQEGDTSTPVGVPRRGTPALTLVSPGGGHEHLRGFPADLAMVPLFAVGEVLLVGAFELLHGTNVGPED